MAAGGPEFRSCARQPSGSNVTEVASYRRNPASETTIASPAISILLPAFNGGRFLDEQLRSVLLQTFSLFELLIYDDGSTDGTWAIIKAHADADVRIRAWNSSKNSGQGDALLYLLDRAKAPLISFCDQDDVWAPDKLELLVRRLGSADLAYGASPLIDANGHTVGQDLFAFTGPPNAGRDPIQYLAVNTTSAHAMLVRRDLLSSRHFNQMSDFDHLIAIAASARNGVVYVETSFTLHRIHDRNKTHSKLTDKRPRRPANELAKSRHKKAQAPAALITAALNSLNPAAPMRSALERLHAIANELLVSHAWLVNATFDARELEVLLRSISSDERAIRRVIRRFRKLARGPLHPGNWLNAFPWRR